MYVFAAAWRRPGRRERSCVEDAAKGMGGFRQQQAINHPKTAVKRQLRVRRQGCLLHKNVEARCSTHQYHETVAKQTPWPDSHYHNRPFQSMADDKKGTFSVKTKPKLKTVSTPLQTFKLSSCRSRCTPRSQSLRASSSSYVLSTKRKARRRTAVGQKKTNAKAYTV